MLPARRRQLLALLQALPSDRQRACFALADDLEPLLAELPERSTPADQALEIVDLLARRAHPAEGLLRVLEAPAATAGQPLAEVVYVPHLSIREPALLVASWFLWDRVWLVRPRGWQVEARADPLLDRLEGGLCRRLAHEGRVEAALHRYVEAADRIEEHPPRGETWSAWAAQGVSVLEGKVDPSILEEWRARGVLRGRRHGRVRVDRLHADLWIMALAEAAGEAEGVHLLTDDAFTRVLLGLWPANRGSPARLSPQVSTDLLRLRLPCPVVAPPARFDDWEALRQDLVGARRAYRSAVQGWLSQVSLGLGDSGLAELGAHIREVWAAQLRPGWEVVLRAYGLRLLPGSVAAWLRDTPLQPALFEHEVAMAVERG